MEKHVVLSLRLGLRLFHGAAFLYGFYFFSEVLNIVEMFQFHWFLPIAALACMSFIFFFSLFYLCCHEGWNPMAVDVWACAKSIEKT